MHHYDGSQPTKPVNSTFFNNTLYIIQPRIYMKTCDDKVWVINKDLLVEKASFFEQAISFHTKALQIPDDRSVEDVHLDVAMNSEEMKSFLSFVCFGCGSTPPDEKTAKILSVYGVKGY